MPPFRTVFVTGGSGYIGSHTVVELLEAGLEVVVVDNFINSVCGEGNRLPPSLERVEEITGKSVIFYECDLVDGDRLEEVFSKHKIDVVIHFAAHKSVAESIDFPFKYYKNNIVGTLNLLEVMKKHQCYQLVFSSSCTVYGDPTKLPITEDNTKGKITSVYGKTKVLLEDLLQDICHAEKEWNVISLRYFNPVGAHPSGRIGEDNTKTYTNVMPYIAQVAIGNKPNLTVFGSDYNTVDGTCIRDYIHVVDVAAGHVLALKKLQEEHLKFKAYNMGLGVGVSVLQLVKVFEQTSGKKVNLKWAGRREGDVATLYCDGSLAMEELHWHPKYNIVQMCEDYWRWQTNNPNGYRTKEEK